MAKYLDKLMLRNYDKDKYEISFHILQLSWFWVLNKAINDELSTTPINTNFQLCINNGFKVDLVF